MNDLKIKYDGRYYGVVGKNNAVVVPFIYDEILRTFSSGLINVCKNDKWGCLDLDGNEIIPLSYEWIKPFGNEEKCVACAKKGKYWGVIDKRGNEVLPFTQEKEIAFCKKINYFENTKGEKIIIDNKGRLFAANDITVTRNYSKYGVAILKKDGKYGLVDRNNVALLPFIYDNIADSQGKKCYIIEKNGKYGVASYEGQLTVNPIYDSIGPGEKDAFIVIIDSHYGLISREGNEIVKPMYELIKSMGKGYFRCKKGSNWLLYNVRTNGVLGTVRNENTCNDTKESMLLSGEYSIVFKNSSIAVLKNKNGKCGMIDKNEKELVPFVNSDVSIIGSERWNWKRKVLIAIKKDTRWGLFNEKGICIAPFVYDDIGRYNSSWNTIEIYQNGKCGLLCDNGLVKLPCIHDIIECDDGKKKTYCHITTVNIPDDVFGLNMNMYIDRFRSEKTKFIVMKKDGLLGVYNCVTMAQVVPFVYDEIEYEGIVRFSRVRRNGKWGLLDSTSFSVVLNSEYDRIEIHPRLIIVKKGELWGAYNNNFENVIPIDCEKIILRENNRIRVKKNKQWSWRYLMGNGKVSGLEQYSAVDVFNEGLALVKRNGKFGYINEAMEEVIPCIYDKADSFMHGIAIVENGGKFGALNTKGDLIIPFDYLILADFSMFGPTLLMAIKERLWGVINKKNQVVVPFEYDEVQPMFGMITVSKQKKKGVFDHKGQLVVPVEYDDLRCPSMWDSSIIVQKNGKWGVFDKLGVEICEPKYDNIYEYGFTCGRLAVCRNNKWGFINRNGREVIECVYDEVQSFEEKRCLVKLNEEEFWINTNGKRV